jgi:nucleoside triphosphatase
MQSQTFPEPIVGAIIINQNEQVLLVQSHNWRDMYCVPGGHVELGETLEAALVREVKEETGLDISDIHFIGFQESIYNESHIYKRHFIFLDFVCKAQGCEVILDEESQNYIWIEIENAFTLSLASSTEKLLKKYIECKRR